MEWMYIIKKIDVSKNGDKWKNKKNREKNDATR